MDQTTKTRSEASSHVVQEDNEFVKTIQKERKPQTYLEQVMNVFRALKHITWDWFWNTGEYQRFETSRKYLKAYNMFYEPWKNKIVKQ